MMTSDWIAGYGAALSSYLAFREWQKTSRKLTISCVPAYDSRDNNLPRQSYRINLANNGKEAVYVRTAFLAVDLGHRSILKRLAVRLKNLNLRRLNTRLLINLPATAVFDPVLPCEIEPGRSAVLWIPMVDAKALQNEHAGRSIQVAIQDELDRTIYGAVLPL